MKEIISRNNIAVKVKVNHWQEAIEEAGKLLLDNGSIDKEYIKNMVNSVKELGPYIVIAPHIAIAHARPDETVIKPDLSIITLDKAVEFGNKDNDPVNIVFAFSAKENTGHLKQLTEIATLLEDENKLEAILNCSEAEEVYKIVNNL